MTRRQCYALGIVMGVILTPFAVMLFDRREPLTLVFRDEDCFEQKCVGEIVPYYAKPGDDVTINWPVIENRSCEGEYSRRIKELSTGKIHSFDNLPVSYNLYIEPNKPKWFSKRLKLPVAVTPGPALYWTVGHRWCNFMQKYIWPIPFQSPEIPFEMLASQPANLEGIQGPQGPPGIQGEQGIQGERGRRGPPPD